WAASRVGRWPTWGCRTPSTCASPPISASSRTSARRPNLNRKGLSRPSSAMPSATSWSPPEGGARPAKQPWRPRPGARRGMEGDASRPGHSSAEPERSRISRPGWGRRSLPAGSGSGRDSAAGWGAGRDRGAGSELGQGRAPPRSGASRGIPPVQSGGRPRDPPRRCWCSDRHQPRGCPAARSARGAHSIVRRLRAGAGPMSTTAPALAPDLVVALKRLKLSRVRALAPEVLQTAKTQRWSPEELLRTLVEAEITARDDANLAARLKTAGFPVSKSLEEFKVAQSSIPQATFAYLAGLEWVRAV